jgi:hypothetical protein
MNDIIEIDVLWKNSDHPGLNLKSYPSAQVNEHILEDLFNGAIFIKINNQPFEHFKSKRIEKKKYEILKHPSFHEIFYHFLVFASEVISERTRGKEVLFDGEDLQIKAYIEKFPHLEMKFYQRLYEKKHVISGIFDFTQFKKEIIKISQKIASYILELKNPELLKHPSMETILCLNELFPTDYFETLESRTLTQLKEDLLSKNVIIREQAQLKLITQIRR